MFVSRCDPITGSLYDIIVDNKLLSSIASSCGLTHSETDFQNLPEWQKARYSDNYVHELNLTDATYTTVHYIKAAKGKGKTTAIAQALDKYNKGKNESSVLCISTLRSVAQKFAMDYMLDSYLDSNFNVRPNLHKMQRLVISPQSFHRLGMHYDCSMWPTYEVLILDEFVAILAAYLPRDCQLEYFYK